MRLQKTSGTFLMPLATQKLTLSRLLRHTQLIGEKTEGEPVRAGMQSLDEVLLALHPPQGQVWVT